MTDCDRLDEAFESLRTQGIVALHNAGYTMSDGHSDVAEALAARDAGRFFGFCFYHGQDVERAVSSGELWLAFGALQEDDERKREAGQAVRGALEKAGLHVQWDGNPETRILVRLDWKRRGAGR